MNRTGIVIILFILSLTSSAQIQKRSLSRAAIDSLMNPSLIKNGDKNLFFNHTEYDLGALYDSDTLQIVKFPFKNIGEKPLRINKLNVNCSCIEAILSHNVIEPGDTGEIIVKFNPHGKSGTFGSDVFVYTDFSGNIPHVRLSVSVNVLCSDDWSYLPYKVGALRLKRCKLQFIDVERGKSYVERIPCANTGTEPLKPGLLMKPSFVSFASEPALLEPGGEGDIVVKINIPEDMPVKGSTLRFVLVLDGTDEAPSERTISGFVKLNDSK